MGTLWPSTDGLIPAYDRPNGLEGDGRWRCPVCVTPRFGVESRDSGVPTRRDGTSQGWGFKGSLSLCTATHRQPGDLKRNRGTMAASETQTYQPRQQYSAKSGQNTHNTKSATDPTYMITRGIAATALPRASLASTLYLAYRLGRGSRTRAVGVVGGTP